MQYVIGGELNTHLLSERKFPEHRAKFYAMQVALALGHLHKNNIIYRDLKPENILMDRDGYIKLADFGLSKYLDCAEQTKTYCGTPQYMSPEIIDRRGHNLEVDWWALGILAYEMMVGFTPFSIKGNLEEQHYAIKKRQVVFPEVHHKIEISSEGRDFIQKCLIKDPVKRLGSKADVNEILSHPWFDSLSKDKMMKKKY